MPRGTFCSVHNEWDSVASPVFESICVNGAFGGRLWWMVGWLYKVSEFDTRGCYSHHVCFQQSVLVSFNHDYDLSPPLTK